MSMNISFHGNPANIRRRKMLITDFENMKKTEINRRRRLRLEQVREQSKDIATQIRQKVRSERDKQGSAFERQQAAELQRVQAHKLLLLQTQYQDCLEEVGTSHVQAALQPDAAAVLEAERRRNRVQAEDRGREATVKLRREQADADHRRSASKKQQKFVRNVEDLRSVVVASLEKKKQTPRKGMDTSTERSHSDDSQPTSPTTSSSSAEVEQPRVQVYDHGNRFESEHPHQARVERMFPHAHEPDATEAAQLESQMFPTSKLLSDDEATSRLRARGQQALVKERLNQDYRRLLGDLHALAREERLIRSTRPHNLPTEMFLEDYRRKELCTRRQKNMDSAFESVYHYVQQGSFSSSSSVPETDGSQQREVAELDSPARLNVAEWQPPKQKSTSPINSINVAASSRDTPTAATRMVHSEGRTSTSDDLVDRINIQQPLLTDEWNVHVSTPAGGSVPQKHEMPVGGTDQSPAGGSSSVSLSSSHEDEREEGKDAVDHEQKVMQATEEPGGDEQVEVPSGVTRDSIDRSVQEDEVNQLPLAHRTMKCGKHRHRKTRREGDKITKTCSKGHRKHGKEKTEDKSVGSQNMASDIDKSDRRSDIEMVREGGTGAVLSECSSDMSVCKTGEQIVESRMGSSSSTSYKGVKTVVSLPELTDRKHQLARSPEKAEMFPRKGSPRKMHRSDTVSRKICKKKHMPHGRGSRTVKERATVMRESEVEGHSRSETDVTVQKGESKGHKDRTRRWSDMIDRSFPLYKDLSEASTSYMSPPDQFAAASDIQDLEKLLETVRRYQKRCPHACSIDPWLAIYISQLLVMSRKSVENLDVSTSDISTPDVETSTAEETDRKVHHEVIRSSTERKETTQKKTYKNQRSGVDAVEVLTDTTEGEAQGAADDVRMPNLEHETVSHTRQAVSVPSVSQVAGARSYNEFRHAGTEIQSTSTPAMLPTSHQITSRDLRDKMSGLEGAGSKDAFAQEQLHSSCRCSDSLCEFNIKTPPFPSIISDMSLDEYKVLKFPEIFSDYSEKCSERISNLTKKIEQIRGEKQKLIESSGSRSSSASSNGFDSTKYFSPPESSAVMTHISSKDKGHTSVEVTDQDTAALTCICNADSRQQISQNKEIPKGTVFIKPGDGCETRAQQQRSHGPHVRPPPCLWRHKLQSAVNTQPIKELSTIIEAESTQSVCSCSTKHPNSVAGEKSESDKESEIWGDNDIPDVMTEMLRRGLISSPLPWTKSAQQSDHETSQVSVSHSDDSDGLGPSSHDAESRNFTTSLPQRAEHEKFKQAVLESYVGKGTRTPESFRDRESIADKKMGFSQQVAETFAKLGKNPSRTDVNNAFKNLGFKWKARGRDQSVSPMISKENLDPASEEFRQQVLESFVGLGLDSSPEDLEAAFRRLGLDCPGASLCRSDVSESNQTCRASVIPESEGTAPNSSDTCDPSSSTSSTVLPPILPSDSVSSDDLSA